MKRLFTSILLSFICASVPVSAYAQIVQSQSQLIIPPYGGGLIMSTTTANGGKLQASTTPTIFALHATSTSATSTFQRLSAAQLSIGSLSGILKAVAGYVQTALIDLTADITGILPVANGGTGANTLTNLITLATHTVGNFVATITSSGSITVANSGSEDAAVTVNLNMANANSWTALQTFSAASTTMFSCLGNCAFGATATSSFNSAGVLTLITPLAVTSGGTGATSLNNLITLGTHTTGNYLATLSSSGSITVANSGSETAAVTADLNMGNANSWTALQTFASASTTMFSCLGNCAFGSTATSSFNSAGVLTLITPLAVTSGGTGATSLNNLITLGTHTTGNYLATLADSGGGTLTIANSGSETAAVTATINLANANSWTGLQSFTNATSTFFSNTNRAYFGATATTTIDSAGNIVVPSGSNLTVTGKSDGCATWATGVLNSTGSVCGSGGGSGSVSTSTNEVANQVAVFTSNSATPALVGGDADLTFSGNLLNFTQGSSTRLSVFDIAYFGGSATSTFNSAGVLTLVTPLAVTSGGTGATALTNLITLATHTVGNYLATLTSSGSITVGNSGTENAAATVDLNMGNANIWTALQTFANASTTNLSVLTKASFGSTATSSFDSAGVLTLVTPLAVTSGGTGATSLNDLITLATHTAGNYLATLTSSGSITVGNSGSENAAATVDLNMGNANSWTALQTFQNASTTNLSVLTKASFGSTATSSFNSAGVLTLITPLAVTSGGTGATSLNDLITLGTMTTGNYLATLADSGGGTLTIANSGSETAAVTAGINLANANSWTGKQTFLNASTTMFSCLTNCAFGSTATSSFNSAGVLTLITPLAVTSGGTGATSLNDLITLGTMTTGNYLATLSSSGSITVANSGSETAAVTANLNMGNANSWTALQTFANASTTGYHSFGTASSTNWTGGGLTDCDAENQTVSYDATTMKFGCLADAGAGAVDGTGFANGWAYFTDADTLAASSSPTIQSLYATSTATSTFQTLFVNDLTSNSAVRTAFKVKANRVQIGPTDYPANYVTSCPNCAYVSIDRASAVDDASLIFRSEGNARAELGIIGDAGVDNFAFKTVTGTFGSESFSTRMVIMPNGNIGIGTTSPTHLLSVGTDNAFTVDYVGNVNASSSVSVQSETANGVFSVSGAQQSGGGSYLRLRDNVQGTYGYFGQNSVINGGTAYSQLDFQNPQAAGTICISAGGRASATAGTSCDMFFASAVASTTVVGFAVSGSATSTFANGMKLAAGCFQMPDGTCLGAGGGSGDITSVGDVASGAAFDGTQGTTLTFNNAGGDKTLAFDGSNFTFNDDLISTTLDTGQGANELYDMDQNVLTSSSVTFQTASTTRFSCLGFCAFGSTATSSFDTAGVLTLVTPLAVTSGGTGATSLNNLITLGTHTTGNYLATLSSSGSITVANSGTETAAVTADLNMGNANVWTALQTFTAASTTRLSCLGNCAFGSTATSSFASTGALTLATPLLVASGGTGASTLTGILEGNGTGAVTANDSSTAGQVLRVTGASAFGFGALDLADTDAVTGLLPTGNLASGATLDTEWDTEGEVQTAWGSVNIILATEIDTCSEFAAIIAGETGTCGSLVLSVAPTLTGLTTLASASSTLFSNVGTAYFGGTATTTIDSAGTIDTRSPLDIIGSAGTLTVQASTDGADFNIFSNGAGGTLAVYGSAGNILNFRVLDGNFKVDEDDNNSMGTTTPVFGNLTLGHASEPQLMLTDNNGANPLFGLRAVGNTLYVSTSTASATSTNPIAYFSGNGTGGVSIGTTTGQRRLTVQGVDDGTVAEFHIPVASASITASDTFIDFTSTAGSIGTIAGTAVSGTIIYNTFTGSHFSKVTSLSEVSATWQKLTGNSYGFLVEATGEINEEIGKGYLSASKIACVRASKAVYGVYGGTDKNGNDNILSIGTGMMWVTNKGSNIEVGDLLMSSDICGMAEIQKTRVISWLPFWEKQDDSVKNKTAGKAMEAVEWKEGESARLISVIYLGG